MNLPSFFLGVGSTILLGILTITYYELKERYIVLPRNEYDAIMRESLLNARKVRKLVAEDL